MFIAICLPCPLNLGLFGICVSEALKNHFRGKKPQKVKDLVALWNTTFFLPRGTRVTLVDVEVEEERRHRENRGRDREQVRREEEERRRAREALPKEQQKWGKKWVLRVEFVPVQ